MSNHTIIPAWDIWAIVLEEGDPPKLCPVIGWVVSTSDPTDNDVLIHAGGVYPTTASAILDDAGVRADIPFIGGRAEADDALEEETLRYEHECVWRVEGPEIIDKLTVWAAEQTAPWAALDAWSASGTDLDARTHGRRAMRTLVGTGVIADAGQDPHGRQMYRTEILAEIGKASAASENNPR